MKIGIQSYWILNIVYIKDVCIISLYRKKHLICIHIDIKSDQKFYDALEKISNCFDNIFLAKKREDVIYTHFSMIKVSFSKTWLLNSQKWLQRYWWHKLETKYFGDKDVDDRFCRFLSQFVSVANRSKISSQFCHQYSKIVTNFQLTISLCHQYRRSCSRYFYLFRAISTALKNCESVTYSGNIL